ncbi:MAG: methyltransferase domain-containing protein [Phycisphaerales bacterium]|nr:MAG: methyltransferase domain-containing protein [Phycisphaerales bacterium]
MKQSTKRRIVLFTGLIVLPISLTQVSAGQAKRGIAGDWQLKVDFDGRQMSSILSLSEDDDGKLKGELINYWGLSELRDLKHDGNELSFVQINRFRDQESKTNFTGSIGRGKLSGTFSSDRGDFQAEGVRLRRPSPVVGEWETAFRIDDRDVTANLIVKADEQRRLTADWKSQWGEHEVSNVNFKAGKLTFNRKSKIQDREFDSSFEGKVKGHTLSGVIRSDRGEIAVQGKRIGASVIGLWELDITSDSGNRRQLLRINPDLSAMYGPIAVKKVDADNGQVAFKTVTDFGERKYEISFAGQVEGRKLTGELTTSRGTREVTGERRRPIWARQKTVRIQKTPREPDVIYVPTPQPVVDKMLELAQVTKDDLVYDLGCGDGRIVVTAAKKYGCKAVGYDIARKRIKESLANVEKNNVGHLVRIEQRDIFTLDLSKADVVTLYLLPSLNVKLIPQLEKLKPGSRIVSHDFDMEGIKPDKVVTVEDAEDDYGDHTVYLWTTPLKKEDLSDK